MPLRPKEGAQNNENVVVDVFISKQEAKALDALVKAGLHGNNRADAIERILGEYFMERKRRG